MALIEKFHVVAAERAVADNQTIKEGQVVSLNAAGEVVLHGNTIGGTGFCIPYGIAGDSVQTAASYMPGVVAGWQNRVSDYFDETKASAKMTVYHSGGEFATDQLHANVAGIKTMTNGPITLYAVDGMLETVQRTGETGGAVAKLLSIPGTYASGVPGVDLNGDQALGGNNAGLYTGAGVYAEIKLVI
jgi:hypothetical protein